MKVAIVHLSDIHLSVDKWPDNPILSRADRIVAAVGSLFLQEVTACVLLISGDLAYAGLPAEYNLAEGFLGTIQAGLKELFDGDKCSTVVLPGNHDCNFHKDTDARRHLITDVDGKGFGDGSVANVCTAVQDEFFDFCKRFQKKVEPTLGIERIFTEHRFSFGGEELVFRVINTAWCSRQNEKAGSLLLPATVLESRLVPDGKAQLVATALHHPYNWIEPNNAKELRKLIEASTDLVFTGHEHDSDSYSRNGYLGESNLYIEAGPLQENGSPKNSEFNVVVIDTAASSYTAHHFVWDTDMYESVNSVEDRPFIRNSSRLQGEFQINDLFKETLNSADISYSHPFKETVFLDDIFVYPDLREFSPSALIDGKRNTSGPKPRKDGDRAERPPTNSGDAVAPTRKTVKGREIIGYVLEKHLVVLVAPDRCGKTALARTLYADLWKAGTMPLMIAGDGLDAKSIASKTNALPRQLDQAFYHQYAGPKAAAYWQLPVEKRAIIIDDFHKLPNVRAIREKLIAECKLRFGTVVLLGGQSLRFQEMVSTSDNAGLLTDFKHCEMLGFGHKLRSQLIRRWYLLNRIDQVDDAQVDREVSQLEQVISIVLGRDLLPPFPTYILLFVQQVELRNPVNTAAASYGKLYEAWITASLVRRRLDVETAFSYLGELAYAFFRRKIDHFDEEAATAWHNWYVGEYKNPLEYVSFRDVLVKTGFLAHSNGLLRFQVKAVFYFFVAHYIAGHLDDASVRQFVPELSAKLYREDAANIVLFLCHSAKGPLILNEVMKSAKGMFAELGEADLLEDLKFTGDLVTKLRAPELEDGDPEKRRQEMLEARDAVDSDDDPTDEMYAYRLEEESEQESEARRQVAQLNSAFKTIQILGQIARSFAGSLKGNEKREIAETCFSLGLRVLKFGLHAMRVGKSEFSEAIKLRLRRNNEKLTEDEAVIAARHIVFVFVNMYTYIVVRHVAASIGVEKLAMTFEEIRDAKPTIAIRTLDAAIRLEHFINVPEDLVIKLYQDVSDVLLMQDVVRHLAIDRLYYFKCSYDVQQRICSKLGIKLFASRHDDDRKKT